VPSFGSRMVCILGMDARRNLEGTARARESDRCQWRCPSGLGRRVAALKEKRWPPGAIVRGGLPEASPPTRAFRRVTCSPPSTAPQSPGARRGSDPRGGIRVVINMAIIVVMEAEAGIGIIDYELIADIRDVPEGVFRIARPNGRRGGYAQQREEHDLCHDASP
jgi:hypothetical protein